MPASPSGHLFIAGPTRRDRTALLSSLDLPELLAPPVSAHRRRRGPYTAAGTILRAVVPAALDERPELVAAHEVEILTLAPELSDRVPATLQTLTSLAIPDERTRFYSRLRTRRLAYGVAEFLRDLLAGHRDRPRSLMVDDVHEADPTDREFLAVLLRRLDPGLLTVVVGGPADTPQRLAAELPVAEPGAPEPEDLSTAISRHCRRFDAPPATALAATLAPEPAGETALQRAQRYVYSDCTDDAAELVAAYQELPAEQRRRLHDRRADELAGRGELSLALGAIPFHRQHGSGPLDAIARSMEKALEHCMSYGFYDATVELCRRGRTLAPWDERPDLWWLFTRKLPTCLSALWRAEEAEAICHEGRVWSTNPLIHLQFAYATAMLYTRHHAQHRRDHDVALAWINTAVMISSLLPDRTQQVINTVFHNNGLALVEVHRGRPERALTLVTDGIAELDSELGPHEHQLHRSVLRYNRAQVLAGLGRLPEAIADYRAVVDADPYYPEYHFDLGNLLRRMGRDGEALAEYETAMRLGPPFPEPYYNRGDLRLAAGDLDGALADFGYVLELDPSFVDAYVNRAGLLLELGEIDAAEQDATEGLRRDPDNAHLHAVLGHVHAERDDPAAAIAAFERALAADPTMVAALAGRAAAANQLGDTTAALADLHLAVSLDPENPALLFNRAHLLRTTGRERDALADLDAAALLAPDDEDIAAARLACQAAMSVT